MPPTQTKPVYTVGEYAKYTLPVALMLLVIAFTQALTGWV